MSSSQPISCVTKRTHRVFRRTHCGSVSSLLRNSTLEKVFWPFPDFATHETVDPFATPQKPVVLKPVGRMSVLGEFDLPGVVSGCFRTPILHFNGRVAGSWLGIARTEPRKPSDRKVAQDGTSYWPHIARYCETIAAIPHIARYLLREVSTPQKWCDTPPWHLVSHRHICAIPHFATYRATIVRYPTRTSMKEFCDTIATHIERYEKYRCWASKRDMRMTGFIVAGFRCGLGGGGLKRNSQTGGLD